MDIQGWGWEGPGSEGYVEAESSQAASPCSVL